MGQVRGAGGGNFSFVSATLGGNKTITSTESTYEDVGLDLNITVSGTSEVIIIGFHGDIQLTSASATNCFLAYQIDSDTDVPVLLNNYSQTQVRPMSFSVPVSGLSAGSHEISLRGARSGVANFNVLSARSVFWVLQV